MYWFLKLLLLFERDDLHVGGIRATVRTWGSEDIIINMRCPACGKYWDRSPAHWLCFQSCLFWCALFSSLCMWALSPCWVNLITFSSRTGCLPYGSCSFVGQRLSSRTEACLSSVTIVLWATGVLLGQCLPVPMSPCVSLWPLQSLQT